LVKGRHEPVILHELFEFDAPDLAEHKLRTRSVFEQAQTLYAEHRYSESVALLDPIIAAHERDAAARHLHAQAAAGLHGQTEASDQRIVSKD
jgi:alkyl sulfatase BDS1-like metallo-beta-lactamase superfamily hydrolase